MKDFMNRALELERFYKDVNFVALFNADEDEEYPVHRTRERSELEEMINEDRADRAADIRKV